MAEDETLEQALVVVRQNVVPSLTVDPAVNLPGFRVQLRQLLLAELAGRLAILGPAAQADVLGLCTPTVGQDLQIEALVQEETNRLARVEYNLSSEQRIAAVAEFEARQLYEVLGPGVRLAVTLIRQANNAPGVAAAPPDGDPLVVALQPYAQDGGIRFFTGYLGRSNKGDHTRLYMTPELYEYVDIPSTAIVRTVELRTPENPLGGAAVWVRVGANLLRGQEGIARMQVQGYFLGGDIAGGSGGDDREGRWSPGCGRWSPGCGRWSPGCGRWSPGCGRWSPGC
jgi:hypothetical protein